MYKNEIPADYRVRQRQQIKPDYRMQTNETEKNHQKEVASLEQELGAERERRLRLAADFDNQALHTARTPPLRLRGWAIWRLGTIINL